MPGDLLGNVVWICYTYENMNNEKTIRGSVVDNIMNTLRPGQNYSHQGALCSFHNVKDTKGTGKLCSHF